MQILLIEDEPKISAFIQKGLSENSFGITLAYDGKTGLSMALQGDFDIIILDIMLPLINGLEVCRRLRSEGIATPILMLTALGTIDDKVEGLEQGADDYLVKPFHFKELLARINALTRRLQPVSNNIIKIADLELDRNKKRAERAGNEIVLTAKEYALLDLFMTNMGTVLSRAVIAENVWGYDFDPGSNIIDVYINYLRNKVEKGFDSKLIHTVVGMGYIMKE